MSKREGNHSEATGNRKNHGRRRNHVIPKFHMRLFAEKDFVYTFDFAVEQRTRRYNPPRQNINNATILNGIDLDLFDVTLGVERFPRTSGNITARLAATPA